MDLIRCTSCFQHSPTLIAPTFRHQTTRKPNLTTISNNHGTVSTTRMVVKARGGGAAEAETALVDKPKVLKRFQVSEGHPAPFGATIQDCGVNFAIYSANATSATLCLIALSDLQQVTQILMLHCFILCSVISMLNFEAWAAPLIVEPSPSN
ncbi:hypothetical protein GOBAR_AA21812 [Gossypium barbadense]|uniref:Glycoside hydrolase family 13 N-terminal domain-containing protein n=1 Tax=Gossypium barbadense TaxID=3634 RepID=A0A2P5X6D4_GOSBA|nr:hypothetical protein GOBAR_AA21812 [Gossypium barbadense]